MDRKYFYKTSKAFKRLYRTFGLFTKYPRIGGIVLGITYRCNASCPHCSQADFKSEKYRDKEMTLDEINSLFIELKKFAAKNIHLFGGEPQLRKDLAGIIKAGASKGMAMGLETNAFLLNDEKIIEFKKSGLTRIIISVDYSNPEMHDNFKGLKGSWDKAIETVKLCKKYGIQYRIATTATKDKIEHDQLRSVLELARNLGVYDVAITVPMRMGKWRHNENEILSPDEYEKLKKLVTKYSDIATLSCHNKLNIVCCGPLAHRSFFINAFGDVMPCCMVPLIFGNVREEELIKIVNRMWDHEIFMAAPGTCWPLNPSYRDNYILPNYYKRFYNLK